MMMVWNKEINGDDDGDCDVDVLNLSNRREGTDVVSGQVWQIVDHQLEEIEIYL